MVASRSDAPAAANRQFSDQVELVQHAHPGGPILVLRGDIAGSALDAFGSALDAAVAARSATLRVDLRAVSHWSMLAQAMILSTAHEFEARGNEVVLYGADAKLRQQSTRLDIFGRIKNCDDPPD